MTEPAGHTEEPSGPDIDTAWSMIAAEGGVLAVVLAVAVAAMWRVVMRILRSSQEQNAELVKAQTESMKAQTESMSKLSAAVADMDKANVVGLAKVEGALTHVTTRLDRHETRIDDLSTHHHTTDRRLALLEHGSGHSGVRPVTRASGDKD